MQKITEGQIRGLSAEEIDLVFGGVDTIVVTGSRDNWDMWGYWSYFFDNGGGYGDYGSGNSSSGGGDPAPAPTDTDGDGVPDADDLDPKDPNVSTQEIVVNGLRVDQADRAETLKERHFLLDPMFGGHYVNAEQNGDGTWTIRQTDNPTADQIKFKHNYDKVHAVLWGTTTEAKQEGLASALTDRGFDLTVNTIDIGRLYVEYRDLLNSGAATDRTGDGFIDWIYATHPSPLLPPNNHTSSDATTAMLFDPTVDPGVYLASAGYGYTYDPYATLYGNGSNYVQYV